jgi:hypothetical protein
LGRFWTWWKRVARKIADFQGRLILTVFYFTVLVPFALVVRFGTDPLGIQAGASPEWLARSQDDADPHERARKQF